jgi:hypothetical protein
MPIAFTYERIAPKGRAIAIPSADSPTRQDANASPVPRRDEPS